MFSISKKNLFAIFFILLLTIASRFIYLNSVPSGIGDDELEFVLNAKAIFFTGKDISGSWSPFNSTFKANIFPVMPYIFIAPWIGMVPFTNAIVRVPYIVNNLILLALICAIVVRLINSNTAIAVGIIASINPWMIFFGRSCFESPIAITLYLASFYILLISKGTALLYSIIPLFFAFFTYTGAKLLFLPYVIGILFFSWVYVHNKKYMYAHLLILIGALLLLGYQLVSIKSEAIGSRVVEIAHPYASFISSAVDTKRKASIVGIPQSFFSNRFLSYGEYILTKYSEVYAPKLLFLTGESRATYSLYHHGYFYIIDIVFLCIGWYVLFRKKRALFFLLLYFLFIGPLPAVLGLVGTGFVALRGALIFPTMILLIGVGVNELWNYRSKNTLLRRFIRTGIVVFYTVSFFYFMNMYLFQYSIYNSEAYGFSRRALSTYISKSPKDLPIQILVGDAYGILKQHLFFSDAYTRENAHQIQKPQGKPIITYKNISIIQCDSDNAIDPNLITIVETGRCEKKYTGISSPHVSLSQLSDGGEIFKIYGDKLCVPFSLKKYPSGISIFDLETESLSTKRFCEQFISNIEQ